VLYREHTAALTAAESETAKAKDTAAALQQERDRLAIKCRNLETVLTAEAAAHGDDGNSSDAQAVHKLARELSRRVTAHEVNEQELLRRYTAAQCVHVTLVLPPVFVSVAQAL
jgi:hypothetical protein